MSQMLLSIKPQYVKEILSGNKKYEFRKFRCRDEIDTIIIYATSPIKEVVGEVSLIQIIEGDVEHVWNQTSPYGGVLKEDYQEYYKARDVAIAYQLGEVTRYDKPKKLLDYGLTYAPQSYAYI